MTITDAVDSTAATAIGKHRADQDVGQLVDGGADPGRDVALRQSHDGVGGAVGQPAVQPRPRRTRGTQGGVVRGEPLAVAEHATRDAEGPYRDDGHTEVEYRRHLPGPGDQPCRDARERQGAAEGEHAERHGHRQTRKPRAQHQEAGDQRVSAGQGFRSPPRSPGPRWPDRLPVTHDDDGRALAGDVPDRLQHVGFRASSRCEVGSSRSRTGRFAPNALARPSR